MLRVVLVVCLWAAAQAIPGDVLFQSDFVSGDQDWLLEGSVESKNGLERDVRQGFLKLKDEGDYTWYFATPSAFLSGDKARLYNGDLEFHLQHLQWQLGFKPSMPDVKINCKPKKLSMQISGVVQDGVGARNYKVRLNETSGWKFQNPPLQKFGGVPRQVPTAEEFVECLSKLASVHIRGGFYLGPEKTQLRSVRVVQGRVDSSPPAAQTAGSSTARGMGTCSADTERTILFDRPGVCDGSKANAEEHAESRANRYFCNQPVGNYGTAASNYPAGPWFATPFNHTFGFPGVPPICSTAWLTVEVAGRNGHHILWKEDFIDVYSGMGVHLGRLFDHTREEMMMDEGGLFKDTIPISAEQMAGMTADLQMEITLGVPREETDLRINSMRLTWNPSVCFTKQHGSITFQNRMVVNDALEQLNHTVRFSTPKSKDANALGDGILYVRVEGDVSEDAYIDVQDETGTSIGRMFDGYVMQDTTRVVFLGHPVKIWDNMLVLPSTADSNDNFYNNMRVRVVRGAGAGEVLVVTSYTGASRTATLSTVWPYHNTPTPQSTIEIVKFASYALDSPASGTVFQPVSWRNEWIRLPRSTIEARGSDGTFGVSFVAKDPGNVFQRARFSPVRLVFPTARCHTDLISSGDLTGRRLYRPSVHHFTFPNTAPAPTGDGVMIMEVLFQDHSIYTADSTFTRVTELGNAADLGSHAPAQQEYPHGFSAIKLMAGDGGEELGFFLLDDLSMYEASSPYVSHVKIPQERLAVFAADGELDFSIKVPPGTGVVRVQSVWIGYPSA